MNENCFDMAWPDQVNTHWSLMWLNRLQVWFHIVLFKSEMRRTNLLKVKYPSPKVCHPLCWCCHQPPDLQGVKGKMKEWPWLDTKHSYTFLNQVLEVSCFCETTIKSPSIIFNIHTECDSRRCWIIFWWHKYNTAFVVWWMYSIHNTHCICVMWALHALGRQW